MHLSSPPTVQDLEAPLLEALRAWHQETPDHLLADLQLVRAARDHLAGAPLRITGELRRATNQVLLNALEGLETQDAVGAKLLRERFLNQKSVRQAAHSLNLSEDQLKKRQRQAITRLAEVLCTQEHLLRDSQVIQVESQLPAPSYTQLFGVSTSQDALYARLAGDTPPWMIALVGIGGVGKTALAHSLVRSLVHIFRPEHMLWVQAPVSQGHTPNQTYQSLMLQVADSLGVPEGTPDHRFRQVRFRLKQVPYLIVMDNLETEADTSFLLEQLQGIATPTKFLITTRSYPPPQAGLYIHRMAELPQEEARAFLSYHSEESGLGNLAITQPADARAIYALTGGNPLALKLVTGLVAIFPLPQVLADLAQSRAGRVEDLYRHIYWKAWHALPADAQTLLEAMPLTGHSGAYPPQLLAISGLSEAQFWPALQALVTRSLVEVQGTPTERRYGIHALTRTFLQTEIIHWPPDAPA